MKWVVALSSRYGEVRDKVSLAAMEAGQWEFREQFKARSHRTT
ncbi:MAG: hypothetical protein ABIQ75_02290 [Flavobacteriales bacterium]